MKQVRVIAESKSKLILDEDAQKGDYIDLTEINSVDTSLVEKALASGADKLYQEKLRAAKTEFELQSQKEKSDLLSQIEKIKSDSENSMMKKEHDLQSSFAKQI
nr:DUF2130 domain-containing protein [Treponema sp.]